MNRTEGMIRKLMENPLVIVNEATVSNCGLSYKGFDYNLSSVGVQKTFVLTKVKAPYINENTVSSINLQLISGLKKFEGGMVKINGEWYLSSQLSETHNINETIELMHLMLRSIIAMIKKDDNEIRQCYPGLQNE